MGNKRPWKEPGTPVAKYCLLGGRDLKRVLKSLETWSLKNTIKSGILVLPPFDMYLSLIASTMFCIAMKVLGPVEQPKSAIHIGFGEIEMALMSK